MTPQQIQDTPIRKLLDYLAEGMQVIADNAFEDASVPTLSVCNGVCHYRPDLRTVKLFPLLSGYRVKCLDWYGGRWQGQIRWQLQLTTLKFEDQNDFLTWASKAILYLLADYHNYPNHCLAVDPDAMESFQENLTLIGGNPGTGLSFPTVQVDFEFVDLEGFNV
jgi:hypothetical protein